MREPLRTLRAIARLAALCVATSALYAFWLACAPLLCWSRGARASTRRVVFRAWARAAACILGMRLEVSGTAPRPPFLLVVNHLSYVDAVALAANCDCVFVSKKEVAEWPVIGSLSKLVGTIFIDRRSRRDLPRALSLIESALEEGAGVVLFAEGTSTRGSGVLPFKASLLEAAVRRGLPVHYASLSYAVTRGEASAQCSVCWWGRMTFAGHFFELLKLRSIRADLSFGADVVFEPDRKALARKLRAAVSARFVPVS